MIRAAIIGPMSIIGVGDREKLYTFFKELNVFFEKNKLKKNELIFDRLYKKYVNFSDVDALHLILKGIEEKFIGSSSRAKRELYQSYFSAFYRIIDQVNFLKEKMRCMEGFRLE
ncbi:MAG TPA: hypothetical protein DD638_07660 [Pasteurellaceae bacterium]|nr:hypothetical protein [Pasteurellaceae bacterium]